MKIRLPFLFVVLALLLAQAPAQAQRDYVLGVFPYLPPRELERVFAPMAADLGRAIHRHVLLRSSST
jgi:phosphonate transport system substrate-binding protein